MSFVTRELA